MRAFRLLMLAAPCVGIGLRIGALGPTHLYLISMYGLAAVALVSLALDGLAALNFYCWTSALPLSLMVWAEADLHPGYSWGAVGFMPFLGLGAIAVLGRDLPSLLAYAPWAMAQLALMGHFYNSMGWSGVLIFSLGAMAFVLAFWLQGDPITQLQRANKKLDELRGEASRLNQCMEQETLHDP